MMVPDFLAFSPTHEYSISSEVIALVSKPKDSTDGVFEAKGVK